jgi:putative heme-binding domain-containing protein
LSETGIFADTATERPNSGVFPYTIAASLWQDGAVASRWIALPGTAPVGLRTENRGPSKLYRPEVPAGTVFARTLSLELVSGDPASRRRIETQLLHFDGREWNAYAYRWNEAQSDAELVGPGGDTVELAVLDSRAPGRSRTLPWRFHARAECLKCHNDDSARVLGFIPWNLDTRRLRDAGLVTNDFAQEDAGHRLVNPADESEPIDVRARSWLHANCAHCHRFQGGGSGAFRVNIEVPGHDTLLETKPLQGTFGLEDAHVVTQGAPERSTLYFRIAKTGPGRMPQLGANTPDPLGLRLLWDWIASKPFDAPPVPTGPIGSPGEALRVVQAIERKTLPEEREREAVSRGISASDPLIRSLFERFQPDDARSRTLGPTIDPHLLLSARGQADRGRMVAGRTACFSCHRVEGAGSGVGPDLAGTGLRLSREQIVESLLVPSASIAPEYQLTTLVMKDGSTHQGFIAARDRKVLRLRTPAGEEAQLAVDGIETESISGGSLMPEGLLSELTLQEAADLVAYLENLR